jgi:hypothetical protein
VAIKLQEFARYYPDVPFTEGKQTSTRYQFDQSWFCHTDAIMLYSFLRHFCIRRIIEIGSGYSSAAMLDTLERVSPGDFEITFIDPHPERLKYLVNVAADSRLRLIDRQVQDVSLDVFTSLRPGDLMFIDSSHVMKYRSDLQMLMFDVLPRLVAGVHVHFHDVFYPFEYPREWLERGWYWNECYLLRAFLSGNRQWRITLFNTLCQFGIRGLHHQQAAPVPQEFWRKPLLDKNRLSKWMSWHWG